jgi:alpha/beta superfamily hydrolase
VLTVTRDDPDDQAKALLPALHQAKASQMTEIVMDTNHGFVDHRIALQATVLEWLAPMTNVDEGKR